MKIRWTSESIRLRISPFELDAMLQGRAVSERLRLGAGEWRATVRRGGGDTDYRLTDGELQIELSGDDLSKLADPGSEGVYFDPTLERPVRFYIEKDFPCAHPRAAEAHEPATATFPREPALKKVSTPPSPQTGRSRGTGD